jgi:hypothetical protein
MYDPKTKQTDANVDAFVQKLGDEKKIADANKIIELMSRVTGHPPKLWGGSIIGFDTYHYKYESGHEGDTVLIGFSPRKQNFSLYLASGFIMTEDTEYEGLLAKLGKHKLSKGCLYINKLADVDLAVLEKLMKKSADFLRKKYPKK